MASEIQILQHLVYDTVIQEEIVVGELERGILYFNDLFIEFVSCGCNAILFTKGESNDPKSGNSFSNWYNNVGETCSITKLTRTRQHPLTFMLRNGLCVRRLPSCAKKILIYGDVFSMPEVFLHLGYDKTMLKTTKQRSPTIASLKFNMNTLQSTLFERIYLFQSSILGIHSSTFLSMSSKQT